MNVADLRLPKLLALACKVGGMDVVQKLSDAFGGKLMYIPPVDACPDTHVLVQVAGRAVADALCKVYGATPVEFPRGDRVLQLYIAAQMFEDGASNNQVAVALGTSWRQARRLRQRLRGRDKVVAALAEITVRRKKVSEQIDLEEWLQAGSEKSKR